MSAKTNLVILTVFIFVLTIPNVLADTNTSYEIETLTENAFYDTAVLFEVSDNQSIKFDREGVLTNIKIIAKTTIPSYGTITLTLREDINDSPSTGIQSSSAEVGTYFTEISFPFNVQINNNNTYWLDFGGTEYHKFYSDGSAVDTYENGGVNSYNSTHDLYFIAQGFYTENATNVQEQQDFVTEMFGTDSFMLFFAGLLIVLALTIFTKTKVKDDYITIVVASIVSVLVYFLGFWTLYTAGFIIIIDLILCFYIKPEAGVKG